MDLTRRRLLGSTVAAGALATGASACSASANAIDPEAVLPLPSPDAELSGAISLLTPAFANPESQQALAQVIDSFVAKHPRCSISVDHIDWGKLNEKISTGIAAGVIADLIMAGVGWTPPFADKGIFQRLDQDAVDALQLNPQILESSVYDAHPYSLPHSLDCRFLIHRANTLSDLGIDAPPADLDELAALGKELTGGGVIGFDLNPGSIRQVWIHLLYAMGGRLFTEDGRGTEFDRGQGAEALQWLLDRMDEGSFDFGLRGTAGQPTPFQRAQVALSLAGTAEWRSWQQMTPELTEPGATGQFLMPGAAGMDPVMFLGGTLLSVSSRSHHQDVAVAFAWHMLEPECLAVTAPAQGTTPPRTDLPPTEAIDGNPLTQFALQNFDYAGAAEGGTPAWMQIRGNLNGIIEGCMTRQTSVAQTVQDMKTLADDAIGRLS